MVLKNCSLCVILRKDMSFLSIEQKLLFQVVGNKSFWEKALNV